MTDSRVFVIAECGSCWRFHLPDGDHTIPTCCNCEMDNAYRMINAAKECGADACKFQWCSDYKALMKRRGAPDSDERAYTFLDYPREWLSLLKAKCDEVGIEYMVTAFLIPDIHVVAPFVSRFKIAARESQWKEFVDHHLPYKKPIIMSHNAHGALYASDELVTPILCTSQYPTPIENLHLGRMWCEPTQGRGHYQIYFGASDHSANTLSGAVAVGAGARVIESHVRLHDTPESNPDFPHSLVVDWDMQLPKDGTRYEWGYVQYVANIRTAERMM